MAEASRKFRQEVAAKIIDGCQQWLTELVAREKEAEQETARYMTERRQKVGKILHELMRKEGGQALIPVLILMLVGGLLIAPLLSYMSTGLKVVSMVEEKMQALYATDAGVEHALWRIKNYKLPEWIQPMSIWDDGVYSHDPYAYSISPINDNNVDVEIQPVWLLEGLGPECLGDNPPESKTPQQDVVVIGHYIVTVNGNGSYRILMNYDESKGSLKVEKIGMWLPPDFGYVDDSCNLGLNPTSYSVRGGTALVWDFAAPGIDYANLPGPVDARFVRFEFTQNHPLSASAFPWMRFRTDDTYLSWDVICKVYRITSQATDGASGGSATVEAYVAHNYEFQPVTTVVLTYAIK